jgi:BMFP domain-containing protein YqiC
MTTTSSRFFDEVAKLMSNAAGAAQGVRNEIDQLVKTQVERVLGDLNVVQREEFEAVRDMAQKAREENDALTARIAELEAKLGTARQAPAKKAAAKKPAAKKPTSRKRTAKKA